MHFETNAVTLISSKTENWHKMHFKWVQNQVHAWLNFESNILGKIGSK